MQLSKKINERYSLLQELIDKSKLVNNNTLEFKHFKLHADSVLKQMTKDELIGYIHMLYHNWSVADEKYNNVMCYANKLQEQVDNYKHEYFSEQDLAENLNKALDKACEQLEDFSMTYENSDFDDVRNKEEWKEWCLRNDE